MPGTMKAMLKNLSLMIKLPTRSESESGVLISPHFVPLDAEFNVTPRNTSPLSSFTTPGFRNSPVVRAFSAHLPPSLNTKSADTKKIPCPKSQCKRTQSVGVAPQPPVSSTTMLACPPACPAAMRQKTFELDNFNIIRKLYDEHSTMVFEAVHKVSKLTIALKVYRRSKLSEFARIQVIREITLHSDLTHPHIIGLFAAWKDEHYVYLALEWAPEGDLYGFLNQNPQMRDEAVVVPLILVPYMGALGTLHAKGLVHRDIKPENILVSADGQVKMCDFGLAINSRAEIANTRLGTMDYMAPEIIAAPIKMNPGENKENPSSGYTFKVDCWSAGVLAFEVLTGRAPFSDYPPGQFPDIKKFEFPSELSEGAIDFLSKVLVTDPEKRPTIPEMLSHPWIQKFKDPRALVNWKPPPSPPRRRYQTMSGKTADKELDSVLDPETRRLPFSSEPGTGTGKYEDLQQGQDEGEKKNPTKEHGSPKSRMEKPVPVPAPSTLENMHGQKQGAKGDPVAGAVKNGQGGEHGAKPENPVDVKADTPKIRQGGEKYAELPPIPMSDSFTLESGEEQNAEDRPSVVTGPRTPKKDRSRVECFEERMSAPVSPLNSRGINKGMMVDTKFLSADASSAPDLSSGSLVLNSVIKLTAMTP